MCGKGRAPRDYLPQEVRQEVEQEVAPLSSRHLSPTDRTPTIVKRVNIDSEPILAEDSNIKKFSPQEVGQEVEQEVTLLSSRHPDPSHREEGEY